MAYHLANIAVPGHGKLKFKLKGKKTLSPVQKKAVEKMFDAQRVSSSKECEVIFFGKKRPVAVQRCHNRKTFKNKASAFVKAARKRAKDSCRGKNERFKRC